MCCERRADIIRPYGWDSNNLDKTGKAEFMR